MSSFFYGNHAWRHGLMEGWNLGAGMQSGDQRKSHVQCHTLLLADRKGQALKRGADKVPWVR